MAVTPLLAGAPNGPLSRGRPPLTYSVLFPQTEGRSFHVPKVSAWSRVYTEFVINLERCPPKCTPHSTEPGQASAEGIIPQDFVGYSGASP